MTKGSQTSPVPLAEAPQPRPLDDEYTWSEDWAQQDEDGPHWSHHGLALTTTGDLVAFDAATSRITVFEPSGRLKTSWASGLTEAHGLAVVQHDGSDAVWVADNGLLLCPDDNGGYEVSGAGPQVVLFDLSGRRLRTLDRPECAAYAEGGAYHPTSVVVDEVRHGGSGDIWLADGYGSSLLHRFDAAGRHLLTIDGTTGAGRFDCPHALFVDRRQATPRLYVADRGKARLQVFTMEGAFLGAVDSGLHSPSALAAHEDRLFVAELFGRIAVFDREDRLLGYVGENHDVAKRPGWPNALDPAGKMLRPPLTPGRFNSPHGICVHPDGTVFVTEWLIGSRLTRLTPHPGGRRP
jgi:hypothetical protein